MLWLWTAIYKILDIVKQNWHLLLNQKASDDEIRMELAYHRLLLQQILSFVTPPTAVRVAFLDEQGEEITMLMMKVGQQSTVPVVFPDDRDQPAPVDGIPVWTKTGDGFEMEVAADGMSVHVTSPGGVGSGQITVTADADLGAGFREVSGVLAVDVSAREAVRAELVPGEVTDLP